MLKTENKLEHKLLTGIIDKWYYGSNGYGFVIHFNEHGDTERYKIKANDVNKPPDWKGFLPGDRVRFNLSFSNRRFCRMRPVNVTIIN
jgi:hypothetical protein